LKIDKGILDIMSAAGERSIEQEKLKIEPTG